MGQAALEILLKGMCKYDQTLTEAGDIYVMITLTLQQLLWFARNLVMGKCSQLYADGCLNSGEPCQLVVGKSFDGLGILQIY